jgi:four helix bundle protein
MTQTRNAQKYEEYVQSMKLRTKQFALRIIHLVRAMQKDRTLRLIAGQLLRSGTSVGANYRAACRARTNPEFTSKIRIVLEESDESQFWLELLVDGKLLPAKPLIPLLNKATELTAIFTAAVSTVSSRTK